MKHFRIHSFCFPTGFDYGFVSSLILSFNTHKAVRVAVWLNEKGIELMA